MNNQQDQAQQLDRDVTSDPAQHETRQDGRNARGQTAGTTGTGLVADEPGHGESGQLPDPAAPPVVQD